MKIRAQKKEIPHLLYGEVLTLKMKNLEAKL